MLRHEACFLCSDMAVNSIFILVMIITDLMLLLIL